MRPPPPIIKVTEIGINHQPVRYIILAIRLVLALALHMTQFFFIVIVIVVKCDLIIDFFNNCYYYPHIQQQQLLLLIDEVNENCFGRGRPQQSASVTRHKIEVQHRPKRKRW